MSKQYNVYVYNVMCCHEYAQTRFVFVFFCFYSKWSGAENKGEVTKLLLRQNFNNKTGYTLCYKTHLVYWLPSVSCCL